MNDWSYSETVVTGDEVRIKIRFWDGINRPEFQFVSIGGPEITRKIADRLWVAADELEAKENFDKREALKSLKAQREHLDKEIHRLES